jgi:chromosome segregation ATPase
MKKDLATLDRQLAKLKEEIKRMKGAQDRLAEAVGQPKWQLARVDAGRQSAVARLQEAIAAGGPKVKDDLGNVQRDIAKWKEDMMATKKKIRKKPFAPSVKEGKLRKSDGEEADTVRSFFNAG